MGRSLSAAPKGIGVPMNCKKWKVALAALAAQRLYMMAIAIVLAIITVLMLIGFHISQRQ